MATHILTPLFTPLQTYIQSNGTIQTFTTIAILLTVIRLTIVYFTTIQYPDDLPRVGEKEGARRFSLRNRLRYYVDAKGLQLEAYEKVSSTSNCAITWSFVGLELFVFFLVVVYD